MLLFSAYANLGSRNIEDYVEAFPRKKVSLMSLLSSKFKQWRTRRNYERIRGELQHSSVHGKLGV